MKQAKQTDPNMLLSEREPAALGGQYRVFTDFPERGVLAGVYAVSGAVVDILGPMFWAALFVLFVEAEFPIS